MKILVTGATGYIGWKLCKRLAAEGYEVVALYRNRQIESSIPNISWAKGDLQDTSGLKVAMEGCQQVYHVAAVARMHTANNNEMYATNLQGTINVLEAAAYNSVERVVYTSSAGVMGKSFEMPLSEGDPRLEPFDNDYDLSKHLAEEQVKNYVRNGYDAVIVNPSRVFGPGIATYSNAVTRAISNYLKYPLFLVPGKGEAIANYVFIDDVVEGHLLAMRHGKAGENYILGGNNLSYNGLFDLLQSITGLHKTKIAAPMAAMKTVARIAAMLQFILGQHPTFTPYLCERLCHNSKLSVAKAMSEIGYQPTKIETALSITLRSLGFKMDSTMVPRPVSGKTLIHSL